MDRRSDHALDFDVVFVGGGLAAVVASLALLERDPSVRLAIVEREHRLGGNHTWCFHAADLPSAARRMMAPLIVQRWDGYRVHFPGRSRRLASPYACITSERLHEVAHARFAQTLANKLYLGMAARAVEADAVTLADGTRLTAGLVIDARGPRSPRAPTSSRLCGYQKFVGLELSVQPHTLTEPVLFDACIPQQDGFRFMYVLPLSSERVLVEETFFADQPRLDEPRGERAVLAYAAAKGLHVRQVLRRESGVLPMPWSDDAGDAPFDVAQRPLGAGYRAGLFHPVTGYSLPIAVRFALALAQSDRGRLEHSPLSEFARAQSAQKPFLYLLTRLLFTGFSPTQRFHVLEHFYRLPEPLIERFYAAELTAIDRMRVFLGAPPRGFSVGRALAFAAGASS